MLNSSQCFNRVHMTFLVDRTKNAVLQIISKDFTVAHCGPSLLSFSIMGDSKQLTRKRPQPSFEYVRILQKIHHSFFTVTHFMVSFSVFHLLDHTKPTAERKNYIYGLYINFKMWTKSILRLKHSSTLSIQAKCYNLILKKWHHKVRFQ